MSETLQIASSPHLAEGSGVNQIMRNVVFALLPVSVFAVFAFGLGALLVLVTAVVSCMGAEYVLDRIAGRPSNLGDWSVAITGLIYGLTLPPGLPLWMVVVGGFFGVGVGKFLFGGLGCNAFNPALVGRAFLQAAFPSAMTQWFPVFTEDRFTTLPISTLTLPFAEPQFDAMTSATPLSAMKFQDTVTEAPQLVLGLTTGSTGETCAALILIGGVYLVARNMMSWRIPVSIFVTVAGLTAVFNLIAPGEYPTPLFMLFSGGLMLGAVFMATDMVASPVTHIGCWIYGALIGALVVVIRFWGGMPEGVMYAILLANAISPHIDLAFQPRFYGGGR